MPTLTLTSDSVRHIAASCNVEIVDSVSLATRAAQYLPIPADLHKSVAAGLNRDYPQGLYEHQALAIEEILRGHDIALSTPTASGKSLVFITTAVDILLKDADAQVLAIYPAKALIRDQVAKWEARA